MGSPKEQPVKNSGDIAFLASHRTGPKVADPICPKTREKAELVFRLRMVCVPDDILSPEFILRSDAAFEPNSRRSVLPGDNQLAVIRPSPFSDVLMPF